MVTLLAAIDDMFRLLPAYTLIRAKLLHAASILRVATPYAPALAARRALLRC